jgi:TonB family protein
MSPVTAPIAATTSLSILLHGAVFAALLLVYEQATTTGRGIEIQLISSSTVSDQQETNIPREKTRVEKTLLQTKQETMLKDVRAHVQKKVPQSPGSQRLLTSLNSTAMVSVSDSADNNVPVERHDVVREVLQKQLVTDKTKNVAQIAQSTNAVEQQHSILELLHARISNNKEYPYIARRQRREGVATVGFVLHPDGSVENAHLVSSSSAAALDRAALSAVKRIEPFKPAQDYIDKAEEFNIDIVFNLL